MTKIWVTLLLVACAVGCGDPTPPPSPVRALINHKGTSDVNDVLFIDNQEKVLVVEGESFITYQLDGQVAMKSDPIDNSFDNWLQYASYSQKDARAFIGRIENGVLCFDFRTKSFIADTNLRGSHFCYAIPDSDEYITLQNDNVLTRADRQTGGVIWSIKTRVNTTYCAHSFASDLLALGEHSENGTGRVVLYNVVDGGRQPTGLVHGQNVRGVAFSADNSVLVSTGDDRHLRVLDLKDQAIVWEQKNDVDGAFAVAVHPNNDYIAVGCMRGIKIWSLNERRLVSSWNGHSWFVRCIRFSPDGRYLISGSADDTAALWAVDDLIGKLEYVKRF